MDYCGNSLNDNIKADLKVHSKVRTCRFNSTIAIIKLLLLLLLLTAVGLSPGGSS
jgi:hypothetical protein